MKVQASLHYFRDEGAGRHGFDLYLSLSLPAERHTAGRTRKKIHASN
jgi:hypothetical protein